MKNLKKRLNELIDATVRGAQGEYDLSIPMSQDNDEIDALAMGLQMMFSEVEAAIREREMAQQLAVHRGAVLQAIYTIFRQTLSCETLEEVAQTCLSVAEELTESRFGYLGLLNDKGTIDTIAISNPGWKACEMEASEAARLLKDMEVRSYWGEVITKGRTVVVNDPTNHPKALGLPDGHPPITSFLGAPLERDGEVTGIIALGNREGGFGPIEEADLEQMATAATEALFRMKAQEELARSEARFRELVSTSVDGVISVDSNLHIFLWNQGAERIFGYSADEMIGTSLMRIVPRRYRGTKKHGFEAFSRSGEGAVIGATLELTGLTSTDEEVPIELSVSARLEGGKPIATAIVRNIASRKRAEREILAARMRAEEASAAKTAFLATMSHELRTPMNAIIGISGMLAKYDTENLTKKQFEGLQLIGKSGDRLLSLINDVLDISKVEANKMEVILDTVDLPELLAGLEKLAVNLIGEKPVDFFVQKSAHVPNAVITDGKKVNQVLTNLIGNAAKFTDLGEIVLRTYVAEKRLFFEVRDTGIGIGEKDLPHIFEEFHQVDSTDTRKHGGTGLGLAVCEKFVKLMAGTIEIESTIGRGTTVRFHIPFAQVEPKPRGDSGRHRGVRATGFKKRADLRHVLIIEDDAESVYLFNQSLRRHGYVVDSARDGQIGLEMIRRLHPDIVLLDLNLPGMNGVDVLEAIRTNPAHKDIPVVIVSMYDEDEVGLVYGVSEFISKPVTELKLLNSIRRIESHLNGKRQCVLIVDDEEAELRLLEDMLGRNGYRVRSVSDSRLVAEEIEAEVPDLLILDLVMPHVNGFEILSAVRDHESPTIRDIPVIIHSLKDLSNEERQELEAKAATVIGKATSSGNTFVDRVAQILEQIHLSRPSVLIAEDDEFGRVAVEMMLEHDYDLSFAANGREAVDKYFAERPDIVLLDIMMPELNGFEAFDAIAEREPDRNTPIIALTARAMTDEIERILAHGFDDHVSKPIDDVELHKTLRRYLRGDKL